MINKCRILTAFTFLMIIAILPAIAAEEEGNTVLQSLEGRIKSVLESETKKYPDVQNYKVIITMDFQHDLDSDKWIGIIDNISTSTEKSVNDGLEDEEDVETIGDIDDSTVESDVGHSSASNNIISWVLGVALIAALLMLIYPSLKKRLQHASPFADNTDGRRNNSTENSKGNSHNPNSRHNSGQWHDSVPSLKQEKTTEKIGSTIEMTKDKTTKVVDTTKKVNKTEDGMVVEDIMQTEPTMQLKPIVKYGQIAVLSQDNLITENDYMSDNAAGMPFVFTFSPDMEEGTYDIASDSRRSFLSDVSLIRPYVQDFDALVNPTMIVTISKGKLRKKGMQWMITEKAKIEFK